MPRSVNHLFPQIASFQNLLEAYEKARKAGRFRAAQLVFEERLEDQLVRLERELLDGTYQPGGLRSFEIRQPKRRLVSAAPFRDRVVHHAIVRVLEPIYERSFVSTSYACRPDKGTHRALLDASALARRTTWALKTDIRQFFPSIDHEALMGVLRRKVRCRRTLELVARILENGVEELRAEYGMVWFEGDDLFAGARPRGLPLGNLTSQFLANVYLDPLDHYVTEVLRPTGYLRYCDDFVLFDDSPDRLASMRDGITAYLERLRLVLHPRKTHILPTAQGVPWLGFLVRPSGRTLTGLAKRRARRRLVGLSRAVASGRIEADKARESARCWKAHTAWGHAERVSATLLRPLEVVGAAP